MPAPKKAGAATVKFRRKTTTSLSQKNSKLSFRKHSKGGGFKSKKKGPLKSQSSKDESQISKEDSDAPKSFVITRGDVTKKCKDLRDDLRSIFSPYTATHLEERSTNNLSDFTNAAPQFGVTHIVTLSQSSVGGTNLRMIRLPHGPTFWFRLKSYSLMNDVLAIHNKPLAYKFALRFPPLVILNGFSTDPSKTTQVLDMADNDDRINMPNVMHKTLLGAMFKHMFPPMNVAKMRLNHCKRVVFFNYNNSNHTIDIRHYKIRIAAVGIEKSVKRLVRKDKPIPNLSNYSDIAQYITQGNMPGGGGYQSSDSEFEDTDATRVKLAQKVSGVGTDINQSSAVRLSEIGPRLTLELIKIEELVNTGRVLYHALISKSAEEVMALERNKVESQRLKEKRKTLQEENIAKKQKEKQAIEAVKVEKRRNRRLGQHLSKFGKKSKTESTDNSGDNSNRDSVTHSKTFGKSFFEPNKSKKRSLDKKEWKKNTPQSKRHRNKAMHQKY